MKVYPTSTAQVGDSPFFVKVLGRLVVNRKARLDFIAQGVSRIFEGSIDGVEFPPSQIFFSGPCT